MASLTSEVNKFKSEYGEEGFISGGWGEGAYPLHSPPRSAPENESSFSRSIGLASLFAILSIFG